MARHAITRDKRIAKDQVIPAIPGKEFGALRRIRIAGDQKGLYLLPLLEIRRNEMG